jgi:hypothetical protein
VTDSSLPAPGAPAAPRLPDLHYTADAQYVPGVCNIGPYEIARRRRAGHAAALVTIVMLAILLVVGAPPLLRLVIALPAAGAAIGYLQAQLKFCAGFGSLGEFNFGPLGRAQHVADAADRARDRARAVQIIAAGAVIGGLVGLVAVLLP